MKKYFANPELKLSSVILFLLTTIFLFITLFALKIYNNNLKDDYIKSVGAITARVIEKDPSLEKEIVPLITREASKEEREKGAELIKKYGLTESLDNELFPYINDVSKKNNYTIIFIFLFITLIFFTLNYIQYSFFYKRIRRLTLGAKKVIEGEYEININENKEGDFSKLAVSFNSMKDIIRNNITELEKEKQFLVDLLSDISHQLKTPLSSMMVYNDILLSKELEKEQRENFLINNANQLDRMNWLIQSMLKLAKLDAKAIEFDKESQSLNETVSEAINALDTKADKAEVKINFQEDRDIVFYHDRLWLEEAIINIVKNGIEHTPKGGTIDITLEENPVYRRVIIKDTGEGISEEDLPSIFKRFYKARNSKKSNSVGIGLALAKSIVESHNGIIEAKSKLGVGTKFILTFHCYNI
ncbi:HAMP domain-containing histidine kinase [Clostridium sp. YIM B02505]|uniref:histidine kinase n=1 Tax=Clostridium yunnanense TaxID=2800325 RepID=A0ABS1EPX1_9CLOT|nr:HAMP domain-containing sensor histidine kinase [Clostridium yunnanense]MBK1811463.1 HAMP domain-containing histidine kinase [Clostridium yunnanense]